MVFIKCYCDTSHFDWKQQKVVIADGGKCYFQAGINITKKVTDYFSVNGIG